MSDELNRYIGFGRFDPNPQPLTDAQRRIVDAVPLTERATVNELRTQLAAMTAERDEWKHAFEETHARYARMMAMRDTCAAERNAEYAKVAVLREALMDAYETVQSWADYAPRWAQERHGLITDLADIRNALETTK